MFIAHPVIWEATPFWSLHEKRYEQIDDFESSKIVQAQTPKFFLQRRVSSSIFQYYLVTN